MKVKMQIENKVRDKIICPFCGEIYEDDTNEFNDLLDEDTYISDLVTCKNCNRYFRYSLEAIVSIKYECCSYPEDEEDYKVGDFCEDLLLKNDEFEAQKK